MPGRSPLPPGDHDVEIFRRMQREHQTVLADIVRMHWPSLGGALRRRFRGIFTREDVEEVLQDSLRKAWHSRRSYNPQKSSLRNWLYAIALHTAIDLCRTPSFQNQQQRTSRQALQDLKEIVLDESNPGINSNQEGESGTRVDPLLNRLAERLATLSQRDLQILFAWANARYNDEKLWTQNLTNNLGISLGTARVRLNRMRQKIRKWFPDAAPFGSSMKGVIDEE